MEKFVYYEDFGSRPGQESMALCKRNAALVALYVT